MLSQSTLRRVCRFQNKSAHHGLMENFGCSLSRSNLGSVLRTEHAIETEFQGKRGSKCPLPPLLHSLDLVIKVTSSLEELPLTYSMTVTYSCCALTVYRCQELWKLPSPTVSLKCHMISFKCHMQSHLNVTPRTRGEYDQSGSLPSKCKVLSSISSTTNK
jgi:hypothetical protein